MRLIHLAALALCSVMASACGSGAAQSAPPPAPTAHTPTIVGPPLRLRVTLTRPSTSNPAYIECWTDQGQLDCLVYTAPVPPGAKCSEGGAVPTWTLSGSASPREGFTCVDEGSHDEPVIAVGGEVTGGRFRCRHEPDGGSDTKLSCTDGRHSITVHADSTVATA